MLGQIIGTVGSRTSEDRAMNRVSESALSQRDRSAQTGGDDIRNVAPEQRIGQLNPTHPTGRRFDDSADGLLAAWQECVYANPEEGFDNAWRTLKDEFREDQGGIIRYLETTYSDVRDEFMEYATKNRIYSIRVTSRIEALRRDLKKEINSCNGSLLDLFNAVSPFIKAKKERFESAYLKDCVNVPVRYKPQLHKLLLTKISLKALDLIGEQ